MTVTMQNVDMPFFEVLKSLVALHSSVVMKQEDEKKELPSSEEHIKQINEVYNKVPLSEQTFACDASKTAVWEMIKNDTW